MPRLASLLVLLAFALPALAREEIIRFDSLIEVQTDGNLRVTETIQVRAEGREIRRGIFRDIPLVFEDEAGRTRRNGFELRSTLRDNRDEPHRVERNSRFVRVYLGDADIFLTPGVYTYQIIYDTDRQIRFFEDHDEIFWNATGTEWSFPILEATARVVLPENATVLKSAAFTGVHGSTGSAASFAPNADGVTFWTTEPLRPREGLSVVVGFPKGTVVAPSSQQEWAWYLREQSGGFIAFAGAILVFAFYYFGWRRVGRDPPRGVMVPRWDPPTGVSPALVHYIWNRGLSGKGFTAISAAALNLAVRGLIIVEDIRGTMKLVRTEAPVKIMTLPVGERVVLATFERAGDALTISSDEGETVASLGTAFSRGMEKEHRGVFYRNNAGWFAGGLILSALVVVLIFVLGNPDANLFGTAFAFIFIGVLLFIVGTSFAKRRKGDWSGKVQLIFFGFWMLNASLSSGIWALSELTSLFDTPFMTAGIVLLLLTNLLFYFLIGAPTPLGQKRTDEIAGLKRYLEVAEKDRMEMAGAPEMSPRHYETLLPYAIALGLEKHWTRAFQDWFAAAEAAGETPSSGLGWYRGDWDRVGSPGPRLGSIGDAMASSMTASLPAPKSSSSGFSGGSSGGGGGGGGGGGW